MREVNDQVKKYAAGVLLAVAVCGIASSLLPSAPDLANPEERLSFQTGAKWQPRTHIQSDVAMVYGIGPTLPERMKTWKERGYRIHVMTGVAWGKGRAFESPCPTSAMERPIVRLEFLGGSVF